MNPLNTIKTQMDVITDSIKKPLVSDSNGLTVKELRYLKNKLKLYSIAKNKQGNNSSWVYMVLQDIENEIGGTLVGDHDAHAEQSGSHIAETRQPSSRPQPEVDLNEIPQIYGID